jgi:hypothetical protein
MPARHPPTGVAFGPVRAGGKGSAGPDRRQSRASPNSGSTPPLRHAVSADLAPPRPSSRPRRTQTEPLSLFILRVSLDQLADASHRHAHPTTCPPSQSFQLRCYRFISIRIVATNRAGGGKKRLRKGVEASLAPLPTETSRRPTHPTAVSEPLFPSLEWLRPPSGGVFFWRFSEISLAAIF